MKPLRVAIVGGSGYGGTELLRWLRSHPRVEVAAITSRRHAGRPVGMVHPNFWGQTGDLAFEEFAPRALVRRADLAFLALPAGESAAAADRLLRQRRDFRLIDLSGDFRLDDAAQYERWYGAPHPAPRLLGRFVYGLSEFDAAAIAAAQCVANPGCFAAAVQYALTPLVQSALPIARLLVSGVTGSSGSGAEAKANTHHPTRAESFYAYKPLAHQHQPEIERQWRRRRDPLPEWAFIPHSAPFVRGLHVTAYAVLERPARPGEVEAAFHAAYRAAPFVRFTLEPPNVRVVARTNFVDLMAGVDGATVFVLAALDNLGKGMAGTAVQNMNLMQGWPETLGLECCGTTP